MKIYLKGPERPSWTTAINIFKKKGSKIIYHYGPPGAKFNESSILHNSTVKSMFLDFINFLKKGGRCR